MCGQTLTKHKQIREQLKLIVKKTIELPDKNLSPDVLENIQTKMSDLVKLIDSQKFDAPAYKPILIHVYYDALRSGTIFKFKSATHEWSIFKKFGYEDDDLGGHRIFMLNGDHYVRIKPAKTNDNDLVEFSEFFVPGEKEPIKIAYECTIDAQNTPNTNSDVLNYLNRQTWTLDEILAMPPQTTEPYCVDTEDFDMDSFLETSNQYKPEILNEFDEY